MSQPSSADEPPSAASQNPTGWRFTWEAQSHTSILRLLLFNSNIKPSAQCGDLKVDLLLEQFLLAVSFSSGGTQLESSVQVPVPRVLIDSESPIHFRAFEDHIEVKLVLLLSVDHPLVSDFDSILNFEENKDELHSLVVDSGKPEGIIWYGGGALLLQKLLDQVDKGPQVSNYVYRCFEEMPSVNWRDVADNWFGSCCCSFGGVSEKLVTNYAKAYSCAAGVCLLNATSVLLCKNDILECEFPDMKARQYCESELNSSSYCGGTRALIEEACAQEHAINGNHNEEVVGTDGRMNSLHTEEKVGANLEHKAVRNVAGDDCLSWTSPSLPIKAKEALMNGSFADAKSHLGNCDTGCHPSSTVENAELFENQKVFLDGYLGNGFMVRSSAISKDIWWSEFACPQCSCHVGAYPCVEDNVPLDGGIRLFKCCISTCLPSSGLDDTFRNYTLERMFTSQLLESAEDELSFRTIVRDIQTKSPALQIILLNPNLWSCTGCCLQPGEPIVKLFMYPTIKVLFSACSRSLEIDSRSVAEWRRKNEADEVHMFSSQIQELIRGLELSNNLSPPSYKSLQGLFLSSMKR